jgi:hypothetical protein
MKKLMICLLGLPLALSGCATPEELAAARAQVAAADDSQCRSYGAEKGTPDYIQCRMVKDQQHDHEAAAAQAESHRELMCSVAQAASAFGTAEQQESKRAALGGSGC